MASTEPSPQGYFAVGRRDWLDKSLLFISFSVGLTGSVLLKSYTEHAILPALFAGGIICLYAGFTFWTKQVRLEPDQVGDNCYYLGFVFTLASLAYTLYELGGAQLESTFVASVISSFGIALSSTIVGVVLRVLMMQFRNDLTARDIEARIMVNKAMRDFANEVEHAVRGTKLLSVEIRQTLDEHNKSLVASQDERLGKMTSEMVSAFQESLSGLLDDAKSANKRMASSSRATIRQTEEAGVGVLERMEEVMASAADSIQSSAELIVKATSQASKEVEKTLAEQANGMRGIAGSIDRDIARSLSEVTNRFSDATETILANLDRTLDAVGKRIEQHADDAGTSITRNVGHLSNEYRALQSEANKTEEIFGQLSDDLAQSLGTIVEAVGKMDSEVLKLTKSISESITKAEEAQKIHFLKNASKQQAKSPSSEAGDNTLSSNVADIKPSFGEDGNEELTRQPAKRLRGLFSWFGQET